MGDVLMDCDPSRCTTAMSREMPGHIPAKLLGVQVLRVSATLYDPRSGRNHRHKSITIHSEGQAMAKVTLKGSERIAVQGARILAPADPKERLEVSVIVRRSARQALQTRVANLTAGNRSVGYLSREEFAPEHGADP